MLNEQDRIEFEKMVLEGMGFKDEAEKVAGQPLELLFCRECEKNYEEKMFYKNKSLSRGFSYSCKSCDNKRRNDFRKTFGGLVSDIYYHQKRNSLKRKHNLPEYTKNELYEYLSGNEIFNNMFILWEQSNYELNLRPTVNRKNDYKGYSFTNIEPMTYKENIQKASYDRKNGINNKVSKTVIKLDENEEEICRYPSIQMCIREEKISIKKIKKDKQWKIIQ